MKSQDDNHYNLPWSALSSLIAWGALAFVESVNCFMMDLMIDDCNDLSERSDFNGEEKVYQLLSKRGQTHISDTFSDDLSNCLQEGVSELRRAGKIG